MLGSSSPSLCVLDYWQDLYFKTYQKQDRKIKGDDRFDYRLENDPKFLARITASRKSLREGKGVRIEDLPE
jgi:hypothetical protein